MESDGEANAAPDLPRDSSSNRGTPTHSSGPSTPSTRRKNSATAGAKKLVDSGKIRHFQQFRVPTPNIDDSTSSSSEVAGMQDVTTSGYRTETTAAAANLSSPSGSSKSSRQRRKEELDRFKTHTITKEDLTPKKDTFLKKTSLARLLKQQDSGSDSSPSNSPR